MAHPFSLLMRGVGATGKVGFRAVTAGVAGKTAIGAGIGAGVGIYGGYDATSRMEGAAKGALLGAMGGAAIGVAPRAIKVGAIAAGRNWAGLARGAYNVGGAVGSSLLRVGAFIGRHPLAVAGAAGAVAGGAYLGIARMEKQGMMQSAESPTMIGAVMNVDYNQQAVAAAELGQIGGGTIGPASEMAPRFNYANWMASVGKMALSKSATGRMVDSTIGLPQGLHAGRHGG